MKFNPRMYKYYMQRERLTVSIMCNTLATRKVYVNLQQIKKKTMKNLFPITNKQKKNS